MTWSRLALIVAIAAFATTARAAPYIWDLPPWRDPPPVPADNPMPAEKVDLSRRLFYELNLAGPSYMSCTTCHDPLKASTDGRPAAVGVTGQFHPHGTMALQNVAYFSVFTWADPAPTSLEAQVVTPMFGQHPEEMAITGFEARVLDVLKNDPVYPGLFAAAFPETPAAIDFVSVRKAIAAFERTLVSATHPIFRYAEDQSALSAAAKRSADLFNSERLGCAIAIPACT